MSDVLWVHESDRIEFFTPNGTLMDSISAYLLKVFVPDGAYTGRLIGVYYDVNKFKFWRTDDGGVNQYIYDIATIPQSAGRGGSVYTLVADDTCTNIMFGISPATPGFVEVGQYCRIYYSIDGGATWELTHEDVAMTSHWYYTTEANGRYPYAATYRNSRFYFFTWQHLNWAAYLVWWTDNVRYLTHNELLHNLWDPGIVCYGYHPLSSRMYVGIVGTATAPFVCYNDAGSAIWTDAGCAIGKRDFDLMALNKSGLLIAHSSFGGNMYSVDGGTWNSIVGLPQTPTAMTGESVADDSLFIGMPEFGASARALLKSTNATVWTPIGTLAHQAIEMGIVTFPEMGIIVMAGG